MKEILILEVPRHKLRLGCGAQRYSQASMLLRIYNAKDEFYGFSVSAKFG
jgi:hypothetical protein